MLEFFLKQRSQANDTEKLIEQIKAELVDELISKVIVGVIAQLKKDNLVMKLDQTDRSNDVILENMSYCTAPVSSIRSHKKMSKEEIQNQESRFLAKTYEHSNPPLYTQMMRLIENGKSAAAIEMSTKYETKNRKRIESNSVTFRDVINSCKSKESSKSNMDSDGNERIDIQDVLNKMPKHSFQSLVDHAVRLHRKREFSSYATTLDDGTMIPDEQLVKLWDDYKTHQPIKRGLVTPAIVVDAKHRIKVRSQVKREVTPSLS